MTPAQRALAEAAAAESARVYGTLCPGRRTAAGRLGEPVWVPDRPESSYYGPASEAVIHSLIEDLSPVKLVAASVPRIKIEQAIARSEWDDEKIGAEFDVSIANVRKVRAAMDRRAAS